MKKKLILVDGPDGLGKTTLCESLARTFDCGIHNSPSRTNSVKNLRAITKTATNLEPFELQCLHSISNIVDFYEVFGLVSSNHVLDRSHVSTLVYGLCDDADPFKMQMLFDLHVQLAEPWARHYDVSIIFLDADRRFGSADDSYHEQNISWGALRSKYQKLAENHAKGLSHFFTPSERLQVIRVAGKTPGQVYQEALEFVDA